MKHTLILPEKLKSNRFSVCGNVEVNLRKVKNMIEQFLALGQLFDFSKLLYLLLQHIQRANRPDMLMDYLQHQLLAAIKSKKL